MGYFSNGSEGDAFEHAYCSRCVHRNGKDGSTGCHVMLAHILWSYKLCNSKGAGKEILDLLIPREGAYNGGCEMFHEGPAVPDPAERSPSSLTVLPSMEAWAKERGVI